MFLYYGESAAKNDWQTLHIETIREMPHYRKRKDEPRDDRLVVPLRLTERARIKWLAERLEVSEAEVARRAMREPYEEISSAAS
jgi:hypothetical protein